MNALFIRLMLYASLGVNVFALAACQGAGSAENSTINERRSVQTSNRQEMSAANEATAPTTTAGETAGNKDAAIAATDEPQSASTRGRSNEAGRGGQARCQPAQVPRTPGLASQFDMNELVAQPTTVAEINDLLHNLIGDVEVETAYGMNLEKGDFNGDDCEDIAVPVRPSDRYHNVGSLSDALDYTAVDVTITNLRTGAAFPLADSKKQGTSSVPANIKPTLPNALVILHGGPDGKVWAHGGAGRVFLLLDSIYEPSKKSANLRNDFVLLQKEGSGEEEADKELPTQAKGDGFLVHRLQTGSRYISKERRVIYFNGKNYVMMKLPDVTQAATKRGI